MFNLVICDKNREKFVNWFRKNVDKRNLFLSGYCSFLDQHGCCSRFIYESPSLAIMADRIYSDMISWNIDSFYLYPDTEELCLKFLPFCFVRDNGVPTWVRNMLIERQYHNYPD